MFKSLKNVIILDSENFSEVKLESMQENVKSLLKVYTFEEILEAGEKKLPWANVTGDSIYAFSYTSGTTGTPKGAMIAHKNLTSVLTHMNSHPASLNADDVILSYFPMAHVMERTFFNAGILQGTKIGVWSGEKTLVMEDV